MYIRKQASNLFSLVILLALAACQAPQPQEESAAQPALVTSPNDQRAYQSLLLPNRLQVLVVSDPQGDSISPLYSRQATRTIPSGQKLFCKSGSSCARANSRVPSASGVGRRRIFSGESSKLSPGR